MASVANILSHVRWSRFAENTYGLNNREPPRTPDDFQRSKCRFDIGLCNGQIPIHIRFGAKQSPTNSFLNEC
jgi:hypothetical protein